MFLGAMIMGPLGGYIDEAARRAVGRQDQARLRDARQQLLGRHLGRASWRSSAFYVVARSSTAFIEGLGNAVELPGRQQPAAAHLDLHRAGEGAVPQQRHQPRRADPARHPGGRRARASRSCSCSRPTPARASACCSPSRSSASGVAKASAPGAAIIQFFGGIHEIYFPYVLMKPKLILAIIAGGMTGVVDQRALRRRACAPRRRPGSIFAVYAQTPSGRLPRRHAVGVFGAAAGLASWSRSVLLKLDKARGRGRPGRRRPPQMEAHEGQEVGRVLGARRLGAAAATTARSATSCSPATPAWAPRRWAPRCCARRSRTPGYGDVTVVNKAISNLTDELRPGGHPPGPHRPGAAEDAVGVHVSVDNFMGSPRYDEIVELVRADQRRRGAGGTRGRGAAARTASADAARRAVDRARRHRPATRDAAITEAGELLVDGRRRRPGVRRRPCTSARSRCPRTWATGWRSRTAPTRPSRRSGGRAISFVRYDRRDRLEGKPGRSSWSASPARVTTTSPCSARPAQGLRRPGQGRPARGRPVRSRRYAASSASSSPAR